MRRPLRNRISAHEILAVPSLCFATQGCKRWNGALSQVLTAEQADLDLGLVQPSVGVAPKTVRAIARRYEEEGLESALYEKPRSGKERR